MKQAILNLKNKLLIVELPEGAETIEVKPHKIRNVIYEEDCFGVFAGDKLLFRYPSKIEIIGKLTDITEEQYKEWVENFGQNRYMNYLSGSQYSELLKSTAKESFFSYLEKEGIYFENPVEKPIMEEYGYCEDRDAEGHLYKSYWEPQDGEEKWQESINEWWEAEEKVWSKDSCYIFEII